MNLKYSRKSDIDIMQHISELYEGKDISREIVEDMYLVDFEDEIDYEKEENYLKAIHQDLNKIFVTMENIDGIYKDSYAFVYGRETVGIFIEYILSKYRSILDYVYRIADCTLKIHYSKKYLTDYAKYNELLDYLKDNIPLEDERRKILNTDWFFDIRKTRNSVIHNGSTCLVFGGKEKLFQIYDLDVNELVVDGDTYLHDGNCIYYEYYIVLNMSYLLYFINVVFSLIVKKGKINEERKTINEYFKKKQIYFEHHPQEIYVRLLKKIVNSYYKCDYEISG